MQAIHSALPVGWIEQPNVSLVQVQAWQPVRRSVSESGATVFVPLNCEFWFVSKYQVS